VKSKGNKVLILLSVCGCVCVAAVILGFTAMIRPPVMVPASREILYDDFGYTATNAYKKSELGGEKAPAGKAFYVVTAKVSNHAVRVDYEFDPHIVWLYTKEGRRIHRAKSAQTAAEKAGIVPSLAKVNLHPGESASQTVVFLGPANLKEVRVGFSTWDWMGNVLDNLFGGNENILLEVKRQ